MKSPKSYLKVILKSFRGGLIQHTQYFSAFLSAGESEFDYRVLRLYLYRYHSKFWASMMTIHLFFGYSDVIQKAAILLSILLLYYEESLVSSNLDSNLLRFHCSHPNVHRCNLFRKIKEYVCKIGRIFMIEFCQKHDSGNEFIFANCSMKLNSKIIQNRWKIKCYVFLKILVWLNRF